jgi:hypothetical protein
MAERFKAHAWKVCWVQALAGSNPVLSAIFWRNFKSKYNKNNIKELKIKNKKN